MREDAASASDAIIVAIDQGTGSTKCLAMDQRGAVIAQTAVTVTKQHPRPGWVEQDAAEILSSARIVLTRIVDALGSAAQRVAGIGLSTQRESAVVWERATGRPLGPVLSWQDRRTRDHADELNEAGHGPRIREITGLPVDPMFSALKFRWLLDSVDPDRARARRGEIAVGTIDAWLVSALTGEFVIEAGNASRTQLMDLGSLAWSDELLALFDVPLGALPQIVPSRRLSGPLVEQPFTPGVRIGAVVADSHAALYAHGARERGEIKVTYGTGSSVMGLAPAGAVPDGLVHTVAWAADGPQYAYEGNILSTGATLVWLASLFDVSTDELCAMAERSEGDGGVDIVPAFAGLGAPWWDDAAQGTISGLTLGTDRAAIARAATDSIALQVEDVLERVQMCEDVTRVYVDGGPTANDWLMRVQADLSRRRIVRSDVSELSALGAAQLAGVGVGAWSDEDVLRMRRPRTTFDPGLDAAAAAARRDRWHRAVRRARAGRVGELESTTG